MKRFSYAAALLAALIALTPLHSACAQDASQTREDARLITATQVLQELDATPDQNLPAWLMQRAYGIAVIPEVLKGAFFFGGRYGNGVMTLRNETSGRFSNPIFIRLGGGSVGWQIGATSTDVVLVFVTPRSVQNFGHGKFTLGGDASVAAGPVGRSASARTRCRRRSRRCTPRPRRWRRPTGRRSSRSTISWRVFNLRRWCG